MISVEIQDPMMITANMKELMTICVYQVRNLAGRQGQLCEDNRILKEENER